ncbi:Panacea domain-containing protein, partial [Vibrio anguillarum]
MSESVNDVCDYVIDKVTDSGESLSNLKLQKLVYYVQAWYLAFENSSLCDEKFEAWVHGPVSRALFNRFASDKSLYSDIYRSDMRDGFTPANLSAEARAHIDRVLS